MLTIEEAEKLAKEKYGHVDYQGEYPEFYLFLKLDFDRDKEDYENIWVGKYVPKACDTPEEWYKIREEQNKLRNNHR